MDEGRSAREGAAAIRPHLQQLVGAQDAVQLDQRLAGLLAAGATGPLREAFKFSPATIQWWLDFVGHGAIPPEDASAAGAIRSGLPGLGQPVLDRYVCPDGGDYVWYRRSSACKVPCCPTHLVQLRALARDW